MRVTNQMLSNAAIRSGRQIQGSSLLDFLQTDGGQNGIYDSLTQKSNQMLASIQAEKYEKIETAVDEVLGQLSLLAGQDEKSLFGKAKADGDNSEICKTVEKLVEKYNQAVKELSSGKDALLGSCAPALKQVAAQNKEALQKLGITMGTDGTLKVDKEKLKAADVESLEKMFGNSGMFSIRTAYVLARASEYAAANAESYTSQYNAAGNAYTSAMSRFDFHG